MTHIMRKKTQAMQNRTQTMRIKRQSFKIEHKQDKVNYAVSEKEDGVTGIPDICHFFYTGKIVGE